MKITSKGIKNAAKAAVRIAREASKGRDAEILVDLETRNHRRSLCNAPCPYNVEGQCSLCECNIDLKTMMATEECPDNRWKRKTPE